MDSTEEQVETRTQFQGQHQVPTVAYPDTKVDNLRATQVKLTEVEAELLHVKARLLEAEHALSVRGETAKGDKYTYTLNPGV